jgi:hypothetical protein
MAVQASHRRLLPATRDDAEPLALLRKHRRKPQKSMPSTDPEPRGPRAAIRLVPSRNMPLGRTSIPEFPDSKPPDPPSQHIEMSACFPSSSHRERTHAVQTRGARDKIFPVLRSCGRYVVALYNEESSERRISNHPRPSWSVSKSSSSRMPPASWRDLDDRCTCRKSPSV